jgi:hypothetical protein
MNLPLTVECPVHFRGRGPGSRQIIPAAGEQTSAAAAPARVPRIARLMALALRFDELIRSGAVADYAELARLGQVSRARITQIANLLALAPSIQEQLLFLPSVERGRDPIHLRQLQPIARMRDWRRQRRAWQNLKRQTARSGRPVTHRV